MIRLRGEVWQTDFTIWREGERIRIRESLGEKNRTVALAAVAFALHPTGIDQLMAIADAGEVMPPKSTWFEPKLRSGLFVRPLDD